MFRLFECVGSWSLIPDLDSEPWLIIMRIFGLEKSGNKDLKFRREAALL